MPYKDKIKLNKKNVIYFFVIVLVLSYIILKAFSKGNDINVYLQASTQLFNHEDIYSNNPFGDYLYSPLFALLLRPLSILDFKIARVFWAILNIIITIRLWGISKYYFKNVFVGNRKIYNWWKIGVVFLSFNFLNQNLILGQITILILWLTFEGLHQIYTGHKIFGSILLAVGINFKIIPVIALFFLFFKRDFKSLFFSVSFLLITMFLPSILIGVNYNNDLLISWKNKINPAGTKYVFENNNGNNSLNTMLPAYFFKYENSDKPQNIDFDRNIVSVGYDNLVTIMQVARILLLLSILFLIFYKYKKRKNENLFIFWEISYLFVLSTLIFPHQMKYAMLYVVLAESYLLFYSFLVLMQKSEINLKEKIFSISILVLIFLQSIMGRDLIGSYLVNLFDYLHIIGIINLILLVLLIMAKPDRLLKLAEIKNN